MKSEKLKLNKDFKRLYGRGHSHVAPQLVTYVMRSRRGVIRYGITTGKKVGCAVMRNRARRLIDAAMRECLKSIDCPGADIVFVARTRTLAAKSTEIAAIMKKQLILEGLILPEDE